LRVHIAWAKEELAIEVGDLDGVQVSYIDQAIAASAETYNIYHILYHHQIPIETMDVMRVPIIAQHLSISQPIAPVPTKKYLRLRM